LENARITITQVRMTDHLASIRHRRATIARERAVFVERINALDAEDGKLGIAEEVIAAIDGDNPPRATKDRPKRTRKGRIAYARPKTPPRPPGIPETPVMIRAALRAAQDNGEPGLRPQEIRDFIRVHWWPNVQIDAIGPIAWRMAKEGRLQKVENLYSVENETPAGSTAGVSRSGPVVNGSAHQPPPGDTGLAEAR
jgi:hypothetical protein